MGIKYQSFANKHGDWVQGQARDFTNKHGEIIPQKQGTVLKEGDYRFAALEINANIGMARALQASKSLPYIHVYQGGEQVAGFPCGPARFYRLKEYLEYHKSPSEAKVNVAGFVEPPTFAPEILDILIDLDEKGELAKNAKGRVVQL